MLTKKDVIAIGLAISKGAALEVELRTLNNAEKFAVRGAALRSLDEFWYGIVPLKVRDSFCMQDVPKAKREADGFYIGQQPGSRDFFIASVWD